MTTFHFAFLSFTVLVCCACAGFCGWAVRIVRDYMKYIEEKTREKR